MGLLRVVCLLFVACCVAWCDASCNCVDGVCVMLVFVFVLIRFGHVVWCRWGCLFVLRCGLAFCCLCFYWLLDVAGFVLIVLFTPLL